MAASSAVVLTATFPADLIGPLQGVPDITASRFDCKIIAYYITDMHSSLH